MQVQSNYKWGLIWFPSPFFILTHYFFIMKTSKIHLKEFASVFLFNHKFQITLLAIFLFPLCINGQQPELLRYYKNRENLASPEIKKTIVDLRNSHRQKRYTFQVGYTGVSNRKLQDITGEKNLTSADIENAKRSATSLSRISHFETIERKIKSTASKYDARKHSHVSPVRDQQSCGSCWAFAAVAMYESNYLKVRGSSSMSVNASEQHVLDCVDGDCDGGFSWKVFDWLVDDRKKIAKESVYPYSANDQSCGSTSGHYKAISWGIVHPSGDISKIASVNDIKKAILKYGAVKASVVVTSGFHHYTNGVFGDMNSNYSSPSSNHAVLIIGWDDAKGAWIIKNSWGTSWGETCGYGTEKGYMWIKYDKNNIGRRACWVKVSKNWYASYAAKTKWKAINTSNVSVPNLYFADFDGNGKTDVFYPNGSKWQVSFDGTGKWTKINTSKIKKLQFADFNGDGKADVFYANGNIWQVSYGGTSNWTKINTSKIKNVQLADFNGDGKADVFYANGNIWQVSYGGTSKWTKINTSKIKNVQLADFNGDGKADVFYANGNIWQVSYGGTSKWTKINTSKIKNVQLADFNGDGKADVFYANGNNWKISYGGKTKWQNVNTSKIKINGLGFGDFDKDGKTDVFSNW